MDINGTNKNLKICIGIVALFALIFVIYFAVKSGDNDTVETINIKTEDRQEKAADNVDGEASGDKKENETDNISGDSKKRAGTSDRIRVLLSDTAEGYMQSYVEISCNTSYSINDGNTITIHEKNDIITINRDTLSEGNLTIAPNKENGRLTISSIKKGGGAPSYRGALKITAHEDGYTIVNELPVEEYLYGVVSSEVPSDFETEALKVQAVCARGFAYKKLENPSYEVYGADVDDTTSSQVYNNFPETENSIQAVNETIGIVPVYKGEYINAFYFSTSCGVTCNNLDVWGGEAEPYLCTTMEDENSEKAELSDEKAFRAFIDDNIINGNEQVDAFESDLPFYRWTAAYTYEDMGAAVERGIAMCDESSLYVLKGEAYEQLDGKAPVIGDIKSITVTARGDSGIAKEIVIKGSENTIKCIGQNNIRHILCPYDIIITEQDGSEQTSWEMLPSAFFYVTKDKNSKQYIIKGGGFGHGAGMSQNGANEMAKLGYTYEEIIKHYYNGITLKKIE